MPGTEAAPSLPIRVALFVSSLEGHRILADLLAAADERRHHIVGVVTDNPYASYTNAKSRLWARLDEEESRRRMALVRDLCTQHGLPCYDGRIYAPASKPAARAEAASFAQRFAEVWRPDVAYMCVFGQRVPPVVFTTPRLGFFNAHPSRIERLDQWPRYGGPAPFRAMREAGETRFNFVLHHIDDTFDGGRAVGISADVPLATIPGKGMTPETRFAANAAASQVIRDHLDRLVAHAPVEA